MDQYQYLHLQQLMQAPATHRTWFDRRSEVWQPPEWNYSSTHCAPTNDSRVGVAPQGHQGHQMTYQRQYCQQLSSKNNNSTPQPQPRSRWTGVDRSGSDYPYRQCDVQPSNYVPTSSTSTESAIKPMTPDKLSAIMQAVAAAHGQVHGQVCFRETASVSQRYQQQESTPASYYTVRPSSLHQRQLDFSTPSGGVSANCVAASPIVVQPISVTSAVAAAADTRMCVQRRRAVRKPHGREAIVILEAWYDNHRPLAYADRRTVKSLAAATELSEQKVRKWLANNRRKHSETTTRRNS